MSLTLDHVVILVADLAAASADYAALGFTLVPGGEHTDGATHNALIAFADGAYIELIAFKRVAPEHLWWQHTAHGEGIVDFALLPDDIAADIAAARARGLPFEGPFPGGRNRPDGARLEWQTGRPTSPDLPFLCADVTSRALRVPEGTARQHANGANGVAVLSIAVLDLDTSTVRYQALLGVEGQQTQDGSGAMFELGTTTLILNTTTTEVVRARLTNRGEGPWMLGLRGLTSPLDPALTHGARFV